jgi:SOS response regulatory protein OraA/RecX
MSKWNFAEKKTKENNAIKKNYKVAQQLIARGFEADEVWKCILKEK